MRRSKELIKQASEILKSPQNKVGVFLPHTHDKAKEMIEERMKRLVSRVGALELALNKINDVSPASKDIKKVERLWQLAHDVNLLSSEILEISKHWYLKGHWKENKSKTAASEVELSELTIEAQKVVAQLLLLFEFNESDIDRLWDGIHGNIVNFKSAMPRLSAAQLKKLASIKKLRWIEGNEYGKGFSVGF
jgi:hypothetical protein